MTTLYGCSTLLLAQPLFDLVFAAPEDGQQAQHPALPPEAASASFQPASRWEREHGKCRMGTHGKGCDTNNSNTGAARLIPKPAHFKGSPPGWI